MPSPGSQRRYPTPVGPSSSRHATRPLHAWTHAPTELSTITSPPQCWHQTSGSGVASICRRSSGVAADRPPLAVTLVRSVFAMSALCPASVVT